MPDTPFSQGGSTAYLDHAATSPLREPVWAAMDEVRGEGDFNPASTHGFGQQAASRLEAARRRLAACLETGKDRIVFTAGGTASDNLAVLGFARAHRGQRPHILVSSVEHKAVLGAARQAEREGAGVDTIPVDRDGTVDLAALEEALESTSGPCLVSVMWANNEVGTVQPVEEVADAARRHGARFHTDAVQALGKCAVSLEEVPADLLTITAHKLGGPVGIGALVRHEDVSLEPLYRGGSQERGLWPGTQNPVAAAGFAEAAELLTRERDGRAAEWRELRDRLARRLRDEVPDLRVHAAGAERRLPNLLSVGVPRVDPAELLLSLEMEGVAVSSGSACSSGSPSPSHVLEAMGIHGSDEDYGVLRFSFGPETRAEDVERAADAVPRVVERVRSGTAART